MKSISRTVSLTGGVIAALLVVPVAYADLAPADQAAVFKAAGFKKGRGGQYIRCQEEPPTTSYMPGRIETADLNGDGQPEAWVKESSTFCYGHTAESFVLVTKGPQGWRVLLDAVGVPTVLKTKHSGWPDIEVGGPGFGKFPVYRWNGKSYVPRK
jgi:hypothetical protein